jgi:hypothetical protein
MDDYTKEITDLQQQVDQMVEDEADAREIAELEMQVSILKALYRRAGELFARGEHDVGLRRGLAVRGYGDWTLDNVYAFVYETAVDIPTEGHASFLGEINGTDFAAVLEQRHTA